MIVDTLWYVPNTVIRTNLQIPTVKEEIHHYSFQYSAHLSRLPDSLVVNLDKTPAHQILSIIVVFVV
jgi:hypothetical protein